MWCKDWGPVRGNDRVLISMGDILLTTHPWDIWSGQYFQMQALLFGKWPDGEPITKDGVPIGRCNYRPYQDFTETTGNQACFLDQVKWRPDRVHLSHWHLTIPSEQ